MWSQLNLDLLTTTALCEQDHLTKTALLKCTVGAVREIIHLLRAHMGAQSEPLLPETHHNHINQPNHLISMKVQLNLAPSLLQDRREKIHP